MGRLLDEDIVIDALIGISGSKSIEELTEECEVYQSDNRCWSGGVYGAIRTIKALPLAQPEPKDIDAREAVYNLAEKIGIHQLFALTVELRGEPIQPEPHEGHWIKHESPDGGEQYECSRCGVLWEFNDGTPEDNEAYFCPKCGADLRGKQNEL